MFISKYRSLVSSYYDVGCICIANHELYGSGSYFHAVASSIRSKADIIIAIAQDHDVCSNNGILLEPVVYECAFNLTSQEKI